MSIGIALIVPDGVILVADGRRTYPQSEDPHTGVENNIDKIVPLNESVFVIPFGVVQVTDPAIETLEKSSKYKSSPELIKDETDKSVDKAWSDFLKALAADVDINHPTMRAALIIGGISQDEAFVTASLYGTGINQTPLLIKDCLKFIILGGEQHQASFHFAQQIQAIMNIHPWQPFEGPHNKCTRQIIEAAQNTIRYIAAFDSSIGGTVRYSIIRKGFPVIKEIYTGP